MIKEEELCKEIKHTELQKEVKENGKKETHRSVTEGKEIK